MSTAALPVLKQQHQGLLFLPVTRAYLGGSGPDGSLEPFAARAVNAYKAKDFSFKKGQVINVLRQAQDPAAGVTMYFG
jgi:hypothetical protein